MAEFIRAAMLVCGLVTFTAFSLAVRHHFKSPRMPAGMKLISLVSVGGIMAFAYSSVRHSPPMGGATVAIVLIVLSAALFSWSVKTTRSHQFKLAFDPASPNEICSSGPYQYVRHPFYLSYMIFWTGVCAGTQSTALVAISVTLIALYIWAAFAEEASFSKSRVNEQYAEYRRMTGFIFPKMGIM